MTDQCSICLDSTPYSECPGGQCQRLAGEYERGYREAMLRKGKSTLRAELAESKLAAALKAKEEAQRDNNWLRAELAKLVQAALDDDAAKKGEA